MAASSTYPSGGDIPAVQTVNVSQQKKVLQDVLEVIVQLKSDFFEHHQPITDDNVVLQRFSAKFEHLLQMGMKGKTSLLGRKKDYWDYFCECLGSSKGSNEGIKYVKSLGENKTSLGRGRAFIRFCLVHQRLADAVQQCLVHEKTGVWFLPGSIFLTTQEASPLINALYDLNSMHFDLAPRGYDLDSAWPSFANRKHGNSGSWNIPISRRSSITSMDTLSQLSMSLVDHSEVDKLAKDLEDAQSVKHNLIGQIDTLQQEKTQASQSAWSSQGELQAIQEQLAQLQAKHSELQDRHHNMDLNYMQLKMERDHLSKLQQDESKNLRDEEAKRVDQLKQEEMIWKAEMREENERRNKEVDKLKLELDMKTSEEEAKKEEILTHWSLLQGVMTKMHVDVTSDDFTASISHLESHLDLLQQSLNTAGEKNKQLEEYEQQIMSLRDQLTEQDQHIGNSKQSVEDSFVKISSIEQNLTSEKDKNVHLESQLLECQERLKEKENECIRLTEKDEEMRSNREKLESELSEMKTQHSGLMNQLQEKDKDLKELNQTMKENLPVFAQNLEDNKTELANYKEQIRIKDKEANESKQRIETIEGDVISHLKTIEENESEILKLKDDLKKMKIDHSLILHEKSNEISNAKQELSGTESKLAILIQESEETDKERMSLQEKLSSTEANLECMNKQYEETITKLGQAQDELLTASENMNECKRVQIELETEKRELEARSKSMSTEVENLRQSIENLTTDAETNEKKQETLRTDLTRSLAELECMKTELSAEKEQRILLLQDSDCAKESEGKKSQQISDLFTEIDGLKDENAVLENQILDLQKELTQETEEKTCLGSETESLKSLVQKEIDEKCHVEVELKSQIESLVTRHQEVIKQLNDGALVALRSYDDIFDTEEEESDQTDDAKITTVSECDENEIILRLRDVFDKFNHVCTLQVNEKEIYKEEIENRLSDELSSMTVERDHLLKQTDAALDDTQQIKSQLTQTSEQLAAAYSNIEIISKENSSLHSKFSHLNDEMSKLEKEKNDLLPEIVSLRDACQRAEDETQRKLTEKKEIEFELDDVKTQLEAVLNEKSELDTVVGNLQSQTEFSTQVLEESLKDSKNALQAAIEEKLELEGKVVNLMAEVGRVNAEVREQRDQIQEYQGEIETLTDSHQCDDEREAEVLRLKQTLDDERKEHTSESELLLQQISSLEFELGAEQMMNANRSKSNSSNIEMESRIDELQSVVDELKEEKSQLEKRLEQTQELKQSKASDEIHRQMKSQEKIISQLSNKLTEVEGERKSVTEIKEKVTLDLVQVRFSYNSKMEAKEKELQMLRSDNSQLKKKMIQLIKDKDNLWHKTDELVDERKRKASERWQDNNEVTKCSQCKADFSLFLRKHHCRKCGKIYCYSCSDFWLDTPHSSKKSRVCQNCHDQNSNGLDAVNMSVSLIDHDSDDEQQDESQASKPDAIRSNHRTSLSNSSTPSRELPMTTEDEDPAQIDNDAMDAENLSSRSDEMRNSQPVINCDDTVPGTITTDRDDNGAAAAASQSSDTDDIYQSATADGTTADEDDESLYQMITEEDVQKSISEYESPSQLDNVPENMSLSMVLSANDLECGKVNRQNEVWIKPGKMFAIPIKISDQGATLSWEFSSQPKDVVFSIYFRTDAESVNAEEIIAPCKCNAHRQVFKGELMAKQCGVYTLIFDNTYSRLTSKKVHYELDYRKTDRR